jgi:hypothetical protein
MRRVLVRVAWTARKGWASWGEWLARGDSALPAVEEEPDDPLGPVAAAIVVCAVSTALGAILGAVIGGVVSAVTYRPEADCLVFCDRGGNAEIAALIGALPGGVGGLVLGLLWLLWGWLLSRSARTPGTT